MLLRVRGRSGVVGDGRLVAPERDPTDGDGRLVAPAGPTDGDGRLVAPPAFSPPHAVVRMARIVSTACEEQRENTTATTPAPRTKTTTTSCGQNLVRRHRRSGRRVHHRADEEITARRSGTDARKQRHECYVEH
jgi:hypothetical protein